MVFQVSLRLTTRTILQTTGTSTMCLLLGTFRTEERRSSFNNSTFSEQVTFGSLTVEPCDLLHLFFFVRGGDDPVVRVQTGSFVAMVREMASSVKRCFWTTVRWLYDRWTVIRSVSRSRNRTSFRLQESKRINSHFPSSLPMPVSRMSVCTSGRTRCTVRATDTDVTALPVLTEVEDAEFMAALTTTPADEEAVARNLTDLSGQDGSAGYEVENDWGTWVQKLKFYYIPKMDSRCISTIPTTLTFI